MASCEVEPLDLSMEALHGEYDHDFEKITASEDMRQKMQELAKEMSHFSYKDLWTECCRRYKDIVKRLLGYEVHSDLMKDHQMVLEAPVLDNGRKRKPSDGSTDSGVCEDSALPLKKRLLRTTYEENSDDVFDAKESKSGPKMMMEQTLMEQIIPQTQQVHSVDCCRSVPRNEPKAPFAPLDSLAHHYYECCAPPVEHNNDLPCDLRTQATLHQHVRTSVIPVLSKYDNSEILTASRERGQGLLARLLTEPQVFSLKCPPQQKTSNVELDNSHRNSNVNNHPIVSEDQRCYSSQVTNNRTVYASPYLNTSIDHGRYAQLSSQMIVTAHQGAPHSHLNHSRIYGAPLRSGLENSHRGRQAGPGQSPPSRHTSHKNPMETKRTTEKTKVRSVRENHKDKILKRLLQCSFNPKDDSTSVEDNKIKNSDNLKEYLKSEAVNQNSYLGLIEQACVRMAFM